MKVLAFLSLSVAVCLADTAIDEYWQRYKDNHNKQYDDLQDKYRRIVWENNFRYVNQHNLEADLGLHSYRLGINEYSDLTVEEHNKYLNGYRPSNVSKSIASHFITPDNIEVPEEVDWRRHGYVTGVKNQGNCGSCWAFSATGSLEGQHFKQAGKLVSLSEQNLVDCSKAEGNQGCMGGLMNQAFQYVKENSGIDTEESYPYEAKDSVCRFRRADTGATDTGFVNIPEGDEDALMKAVATMGPISVAMDASRPTFHEYRHGIYEDAECSDKMLDHGVLVVGYGKKQGKKYWLIKNSWGESWGLDGYFMLARDRGNMCGVATQASYPLV